MADLTIGPIGYVRSSRSAAEDDDWDAVTSSIELDSTALEPSATLGLDSFSHIEVVYLFHLVDETKVCRARATHADETTGPSPASWRNARRIDRTASASRPVASNQRGRASSWTATGER